MHTKFGRMRFQRLTPTKSHEGRDLESVDDEVFRSGEEEGSNLNCQTHESSSDMLTLEGLRRTYNSCSNCGVCWYDDHVSLDCRECGGYAMRRPCPTCDGRCGNVWRRDVKASHSSKHAEWHGTCSMPFQWPSQNMLDTTTEDANANFHTTNHRLSRNIMEATRIM